MRLGERGASFRNRSALEWVIDQYRVSTDKLSGIVNDPNRPDDPESASSPPSPSTSAVRDSGVTARPRRMRASR